MSEGNIQIQNLKMPFKKSSHISERIWKGIFFCVTIFFAILFKKMYQFRTNPQNIEFLRGSLSHLLYAIPIMISFYVLQQCCIKKFQQILVPQICQQKYPLQEKRKEKAKLLSRWIYDIFYYFLTSMLGFLIMRNHQSFPDILSSSIQCNNILNQNIPPELQTSMEIFYLIQFSHHMNSLVSHLALQNYYGKSKYYEYCLHHSLAVFLIFYSYMQNLWAVGSMVLIFHDFSDFFLIFSRFYYDIKYESKLFQITVLPLFLFVWIGFRLILFPNCCIKPIIFYDRLYPELMFMGAMQFGLFVMHIYWTYFILKAVLGLAKKK